MWGLFKKKSVPPSAQMDAFAERWFWPQSLAVAVAEAVRSYAEEVNAGRVSHPAHRRKGSSVVEIWHDLRLEALHSLFNFGQADPFLLSDQKQQMELLSCFLDERPHLEMPQPRGEIVPDTIQAMWQIYVYLDEVGSELADCETDRETLKMTGRSILDNLIAQAVALRASWEAFEDAVQANAGPLPEMPKTLIEALYEDVTAKAKSVALSAMLGPSHEGGIKYLERRVEERGGDAASVRATFERILAAKDPDDFVG